MSACNILVQKRRNAVHVMVDGVSYDKSGIIVEKTQKCIALPTLHMAMTVMGPVHADLVMASHLSKRFTSFDDLIDGVEDYLPAIFELNLGLLSESGIPDSRVYFAGWSEKQRAPLAYSMNCIPPESEAYWRAARGRESAVYGAANVIDDGDEPFKLIDLREATGSAAICNPPWAEHLSMAECGMQFDAEPAEIPDLMNPELDLLTIMEMQRRRKVPLRPGETAAHWVGGFALLTSITEAGISQRIVQRWPEDRIGQLINPKPIYWKAWRAARAREIAKAA
jgi:hypothetical protein